jgi:hypothetical protein
MLGMKKKYNYRFACNAKINSCYDKMVFGGKTRHKVRYPKNYKNSNEFDGSLFFGKLGVKSFFATFEDVCRVSTKKLIPHSVLRLDATIKKRYDGKLFKFKKISIK